MLRKLTFTILGLMVFSVAVAAQKNAPNVSKATPANAGMPAGQFSETWVEHNMLQNKGKPNEIKGMVVHAKFSVQNALNDRCQMRIGFFYDNGKPLMGNQTGFKSTAGTVVAYKDFTPTYERADYADFQIFVPYTALNMDAGQSKLKLQLFMYDYQSNKIFSKSQFVSFTINQR